MTLGQKIKQYRIQKDFTQKDLADQVHVTFQTVSKWEKDENEPDVATLRELAKLFGCTLDDLLSEEDIGPAGAEAEEPATPEPVPEPPAPPVAPEPVVKTIVIHQKELHVCARCKRDIPEDDVEIDRVPHRVGSGRTATTTYSEEYYHTDCYRQTLKERKEKEERRIAENARHAKTKCFGWGIAVGIIAFGTSLGLMLYFGQGVIHPGLAVLYSVLIGYAGFADLYCILSGSYIEDVFLAVASWSFRFPGIIFSFDLGGFVFLIVMKLLFAILGFFIGVAVFLLAVVLSAALSAVSFPFVLVHNIDTKYKNAI